MKENQSRTFGSQLGSGHLGPDEIAILVVSHEGEVKKVYNHHGDNGPEYGANECD